MRGVTGSGDGDAWVELAVADAGSCPACGGVDVHPIVYGYPTADAYQRLHGVVEFAGCCIPADPLRLRCGACGAGWGAAALD